MNKYYRFKELTDAYINNGFVRGMARVLDVGSTANKRYSPKNVDNIDEDAMLSDWIVVGNDIRRAFNDFNR